MQKPMVVVGCQIGWPLGEKMKIQAEGGGDENGERKKGEYYIKNMS